MKSASTSGSGMSIEVKNHTSEIYLSGYRSVQKILLMKCTSINLKGFILLALLFVVLPTFSQAKFTDNSVKYQVISGTNTVKVIKNNPDYIGNVTIPASVIYNNASYSVTAIGDSAFYYCTGLTTVSLPQSLKTIGKWAFSNCWGLLNVTIPSQVETIDNFAFHYCTSLTNVTFPASLKSIGDNAFIGCGQLNNIVLQEGITSIGEFAFSLCTNVAEIKIPASLTGIGNFAFYLFSGRFVVDNNNPYYSGSNGILYDKQKTTLIKCPVSVSDSIVIPSTVTTIAREGFRDCSKITSITIPASVQSIGDEAFRECTALHAIYEFSPNPYELKNSFIFYKIGSSVLYVPIGSKTKYQAANVWNIFTDIREMGGATGTIFMLNGIRYQITSANTVKVIKGGSYTGNISVPPIANYMSTNYNVTAIGDSAFLNCANLTGISLPESVKTIGDLSFSNCWGLSSITIPKQVVSIGNLAFHYCLSMTSVTFSDSLRTIGNQAFEGCTKLEDLVFPSKLESVGESSFSLCQSVATVNIPASLTVIGNNAFWSFSGLFNVDSNNPYYSSEKGILYDKQKTVLIKCPLSIADSVVVPNSVASIAREAFRDCNKITSISIPSSVQSLGIETFRDCSALRAIYEFSADPYALQYSSTFYNVSNCTLYVPIGSKVKYQNANIWKNFTNIVELESLSKFSLKLNSGESGTINLICDYASKPSFNITASKGWKIYSVTYNGENVTNKMVNGVFAVPALYADGELSVVFVVETGTTTPESGNKIKVLTSHSDIVVEGADLGERIMVYSLNGTLIKCVSVSDDRTIIPVQNNGIYLINTGQKTFKVAL